MSDPDDIPDDDPAMDQFAEEFERHRDALYEHIYAFMEEEEVSEVYVAQLLADAMIRMRMTAYGLGVESPSVAGLKLDLDRLHKELGEFLREAKKGAEEYIGHVKEMRAAADAELEDEEEESEGAENEKKSPQ
ncbi:MAG TPA: hypothetical protein VG291_06890 [Xanthobacteraceae bacterium]|jgi:hypothetical protein|nr:hypothetical protein [Xanthobacteraceae bacterium]